MAPGAVRWKQAAPGAMTVLKPGGEVGYYCRGKSGDAKIAETALKEAGFVDVQNLGDTLLKATKPGP